MLHSFLRFPVMSDQFYKALKRKETAKRMKEIQKDAVNFLQNHVNKENENQFFDDLVARLDNDLY